MHATSTSSHMNTTEMREATHMHTRTQQPGSGWVGACIRVFWVGVGWGGGALACACWIQVSLLMAAPVELRKLAI